MIQLDARGPVSLVSIDRQRQRNALDAEHCRALLEAADNAVGEGARCLVVTGVGSVFCAGADFGEVYGHDFRYALVDLMQRLAGLPVPVVAAVNGPAVGAGAQLAIAADLRVAAPEASFAIPTAKLGLAADPWSVRRIAQVLGDSVARSILLGCTTLTAEQAHTRGVVDRLGGLDDALAWADEIAALAPLTLAYYKRGLDSVVEPGISEAELDEAYAACWDSEDRAEGRRAHAEKRGPRFQGR